MTTEINNLNKTSSRRLYSRIALCLWMKGAEKANEEYPQISIDEFNIANKYYDSLRCDGCYCGACVNLSELSRNLDQSPLDLKPIADLAKKLSQE